MGISLAVPKGPFKGGQLMKCKAEVLSAKGAHCQELRIAVKRSLNGFSQVQFEAVIAADETWLSEEKIAYPFEIIAPSSSGTWAVEARAILGEGNDMVAEAQFSVSEPTAIGEYFSTAIFALLPLAASIGMAMLTLNIFEGGYVPVGVRWFTLLVAMGASFLAYYLLNNGGKGFFDRPAFLVFTGASAYCLYIAYLNPALTGIQRPQSLLSILAFDVETAHRGAFALMLAHVYALFAGAALAGKQKNANVFWEILLLNMAFALSIGLLARMAIRIDAGEIFVLAIAAYTAYYLSRRPTWANVQPAYIHAGAFFLAIMAFFELASASEQRWLSLAVAIGLLLAGAFIWYRGNRNLLAERHLGKVHVEISPSPLKMGGKLRCKVSHSPRKPVNIGRVTAKLLCFETTIRKNADNERSSSTNLAFQKKEEIAVGQLVSSEINHIFSMLIPIGVKPTQRDSSFSVRWELEVHIEVDGAPDWDKIFDVVIEK